MELEGLILPNFPVLPPGEDNDRAVLFFLADD